MGVMNEPAVLLRDFANTLDIEPGVDNLDTPAKLAEWLAAHHLIAAGSIAETTDLTTAVTLRTGLRAAMYGHHGPEPRSIPGELDDVLAGLPVRVSVAQGTPTLVPANGGVTGGLSRLAAAIMDTVADGTWSRLKVCKEETCRWAFVDTSKNRSRAWCSMRACGNRTKTRAYRARRKIAEEAE
jgi:predicted RNA-binding Zn ribbon-like protein